MISLKWFFCVVSVSGLLVACGGGDDGAAGSGSSDGSTGGGGSGGGASGGSTGTGGADPSGAGGTGAAELRSYGSTFRSLSEVCDILSYAQKVRFSACTGLGAVSAPSPSYGCPDVLFSEGSTRGRTPEEAWDCVDEWAALSCQDLFDGKVPSCVSPGTLPVGAPCVAGSQCQSLNCNAGDLTCGVCLAIGDGVTCDEQTACLGFDYCDNGVCVDYPIDPKSLPVPQTPAGPNEACDDGTCVEGYVCAANDALDARICRPVGNLGQPCYSRSALALEDRFCSQAEDFVFCDRESNTCRAPGAVGEACVLYATQLRCALGASCNALGICALPGGPGTPCLEPAYPEFRQCGDGEFCDDGTCKTRRNYGESCASELTEWCAGTGTCEAGVCTPNDTLTWESEYCGGP